jgi:hypothetical protein
VTSNVPIIAYQFNPLENVEVFSNDASLLIPTNSLDGQYRVLGWPQNFSNVANPDGGRSLELRAYMTIVGVRERTTVTITPTADVIPGGPLRERLSARTPFRVVLGPFDVLNLETGSFLADFTGSTIDADQAVAVFTGTECSDVPFWTTVSERRGNCDHLEQQLVPVSTTGNRYVASRFPRRTPPVAAAGASVAQVTEPEWFRVLNVSTAPVRVDTTLPRDPAMPDGPTVSFDLAVGAHRDLMSTHDFTLRGSGRITLAQLMAGQTTTGIPFPLPGGDPSLLIVPSVEQWRADYVFLTPDKYAFDFVQIVARPSARVFLDETPVDGFSSCTRDRSDGCIDTPRRACPPPAYVTWRCQLSFPRIEVEHTTVRVLPGRQGDGVHTVRAVPAVEGAEAETVMVIVSGFDQRVSYAYAAGTNLTPIP